MSVVVPSFLLLIPLLLSSSPVGPVAICFYGELLGRSSNETIQSIGEHFLKPIAAEAQRVDIFYAVSEKDVLNKDSYLLLRKFKRFSESLNRNIKFQFISQDESSPVEFQLEEELFDFENTKNLELLDPPGQAFCGSRLWVYRMLHLCREYILKAEEESGEHYQYVIRSVFFEFLSSKSVLRSRPDYHWLCPHFPLSYLSRIQEKNVDDSKIWVPDGEDYGGINDRHAVISREVFRYYFSQWLLLTGNQAFEVVSKILDDHKKLAEGEEVQGFRPLGSEVYLMSTLFYADRFRPISIDRIPSCAYIFCTGFKSLNKENNMQRKKNYFGGCAKRTSEWQSNYPCMKVAHLNQEEDKVEEENNWEQRARKARMKNMWDLRNVKYRVEFNKTKQVAECLENSSRSREEVGMKSGSVINSWGMDRAVEGCFCALRLWNSAYFGVERKVHSLCFKN